MARAKKSPKPSATVTPMRRGASKAGAERDADGNLLAASAFEYALEDPGFFPKLSRAAQESWRDVTARTAAAIRRGGLDENELAQAAFLAAHPGSELFPRLDPGNREIWDRLVVFVTREVRRIDAVKREKAANAA